MKGYEQDYLVERLKSTLSLISDRRKDAAKGMGADVRHLAIAYTEVETALLRVQAIEPEEETE